MRSPAGTSCRRWFDGTGIACAAVFCQIGEQTVHLVVCGAINEIAPLLFGRNKAGVQQFLEVKGQRIAGDLQTICHNTWRKARLSSDDQRAENAQPLRVSKCSKS